ncbi:MAG: hypothetical protein ACI9RU_002793 [Litorivivens sp.]|jgi:hypothetical protein
MLEDNTNQRLKSRLDLWFWQCAYTCDVGFSLLTFLAELEGTFHFRNCSKHSSLLAWVLMHFYSSHTYKNTDRRLSALFLLFDAHSLGK